MSLMYLLLNMIFNLILYWYIHSSDTIINIAKMEVTKQHTAKQPHFNLIFVDWCESNQKWRILGKNIRNFIGTKLYFYL